LSFADCIGDELPYGWEMAFDSKVGVYYIDHIHKKNQLIDPRIAWRNLQINMLNNYLQQAGFSANKPNLSQAGSVEMSPGSSCSFSAPSDQEINNYQINCINAAVATSNTLANSTTVTTSTPLSTPVTVATTSTAAPTLVTNNIMTSTTQNLNQQTIEIKQRVSVDPSSTSSDVTTDPLLTNQALLGQSLTDAKQRVAQLKRELDSNHNLLNLIDN